MDKTLAVFGSELVGIQPSLHTRQGSFWKTGANVVFRDGSVGKQVGWASALTAPSSSPVRGIGQILETAGPRVYWGTPTKLYDWDLTTVTTHSPTYTGPTDETLLAPAAKWGFVPWGQWMLATNGKDKVQINKGAGFVDLAGVTFTKARILVRMRAHVIAMNTSNSPQNIEWCSADDVEDWTPVSTNSAGDYFIRDMESGIRAAAALGDRYAIFGTNSMALLSYIGAPFYFSVVPGLTGIGAVGQDAVVSIGRKIYGLSSNGFFVTDGVQYQYIDDPDVREYFTSHVNSEQLSKISATHDVRNGMVKWYYPSGTSTEPNTGIGYDYLRDRWSFFDYGRTAVAEKNVLAYAIEGASDGKVFLLGASYNADGGVLTPWLRTKALDFATQQAPHVKDSFKYIDSVKFLFGELTGAFKARLGIQNRLNEAITWTDWQTVTDSMEPAYFRVSGRYIILDVKSDSLGDAWWLSGIEFFGAVNGVGP